MLFSVIIDVDKTGLRAEVAVELIFGEAVASQEEPCNLIATKAEPGI
jgi:hypothetical protein